MLGFLSGTRNWAGCRRSHAAETSSGRIDWVLESRAWLQLRDRGPRIGCRFDEFRSRPFGETPKSQGFPDSSLHSGRNWTLCALQKPRVKTMPSQQGRARSPDSYKQFGGRQDGYLDTIIANDLHTHLHGATGPDARAATLLSWTCAFPCRSRPLIKPQVRVPRHRDVLATVDSQLPAGCLPQEEHVRLLNHVHVGRYHSDRNCT